MRQYIIRHRRAILDNAITWLRIVAAVAGTIACILGYMFAIMLIVKADDHLSSPWWLLALVPAALASAAAMFRGMSITMSWSEG